MVPTHLRRMAAVAALVTALASACAETPPTSVPSPAPATAEAPNAATGTGPKYVAMGDSAAAAPLVPNQADPAGCLKSTNDYPSVLARTIDAVSFRDVTCSGAKTPDLASRAQTTRSGPVPPQLDALDEDTELVTVTIGGNDIDLPNNAVSCRRTTLDVPPCSPDFVVDGVDRISQAIDADADQWSALVADIRAKAPEARVILVGYGTYIRPEGCFPDQPINPVDAAYFQAKIDELDGRLQRVAEDQGVEFFDTRPLSVGHDMCAAPQDRFIEGFLPASPAAPLHPNGMGAAAYGTALAEYVGSKPTGG